MLNTNYLDNGDITYRSAEEVNNAMARVYGYMGLAVLTSMIVSYLVGNSTSLMTFCFTGIMKWIVIFAPLAAILVASFAMEKLARLDYNYSYMVLQP